MRPAFDVDWPARRTSTCAPSIPPCAGADSAGSAPGTPRESRCSTASAKLKSRRCSSCRSARHAALDVGQVVVGAGRLGLERPRRPHAGERPPEELRRRRDDDRLAGRQRDAASAARRTPGARRAAPARPRISVAGLGMLRPWPCATPPSGSPPFSSAAPPAELLLRRVRARASRWPAGGRRRGVMPSSSRSFCSKRLAPEPERRPAPSAPGRSRGTSMYAANRRSPPRWRRRPDRPAGAGRRRSENARGRSCSMNVSAPRQRVDADLDEDARRVLDVVAGRLDEARHLAQLRQHPPGALGLGRVARRSPAPPGSRRWCRRRCAGCAPRSAPPRARTSAPGCWPRRSVLDLLDSVAGARRVDVGEAAARSRTARGGAASMACRLRVLEQVVVE